MNVTEQTNEQLIQSKIIEISQFQSTANEAKPGENRVCGTKYTKKKKRKRKTNTSRPDQCCFILPPPKSRRCRLTRAPNAKFCGIHRMQQESIASAGSIVQKSNMESISQPPVVKTIPCPYCGHLLRDRKLQRHIRRCIALHNTQFSTNVSNSSNNKEDVPDDILQLCHAREKAKGCLDFKQADLLRNKIWAAGYTIKDVKQIDGNNVTYSWTCRRASPSPDAPLASTRRKGQNRGPESARRRRNRKIQQQHNAKKPRIAKFAAFLRHQFGMSYLRQGRGVLDVAGGKGKLAYKLAIEMGIPATVVDPMPMRFSPRKTKDILNLALCWQKKKECTSVNTSLPSTQVTMSNIYKTELSKISQKANPPQCSANRSGILCRVSKCKNPAKGGYVLTEFKCVEIIFLV